MSIWGITTISVDVTSDTVGVHQNTIPHGALAVEIQSDPVSAQHNEGAAVASLTVWPSTWEDAWAYTRLVLVFDLDTQGWHFWDGLRATSLAWDPELKMMLGAGERSAGPIYTRGGLVDIELSAGSKALEDLGQTRVHALDVDLISDENELTCEFWIDGDALRGRTKTPSIRGMSIGRELAAENHSAIGSSDSSGGIGERPHRQTLRFPCPVGGLGIVSGFRITGRVGGEFAVYGYRLLYV